MDDPVKPGIVLLSEPACWADAAWKRSRRARAGCMLS